MAGPEGGFGEESFDVLVCTPSWLDLRVHENGPLLGRHYLVVKSWDAVSVKGYLTEAVEAEEAGTWQELASKLGRIGKWEFEDYRP